MTNRKMGILALLLCFCLCLLPTRGLTAAAVEVTTPIATGEECSLTVTYAYGETAFADLQVKAYHVAQVTADCRYVLTSAFEASDLILNGIQTAGEWDVIRSTLETYILGKAIEPQTVGTTNEQGQVCFTALHTGLYLVTVDHVIHGDMDYCFDATLVALPGAAPNGEWQYDVTVNAKGEALPPVDTDEETAYKVVKLWKGDEGRSTRPASVEVEIFRDGVHYETVILSDETNWCYTWSTKDDGARWAVVERNVPQGYAMTVEEKETSFVLTNTYVPPITDEPEDPDEPEDSPQTGDTFHVLPYMLLMTASGMVLIVLGVVCRKKEA